MTHSFSWGKPAKPENIGVVESRHKSLSLFVCASVRECVCVCVYVCFSLAVCVCSPPPALCVCVCVCVCAFVCVYAACVRMYLYACVCVSVCCRARVPCVHMRRPSRPLQQLSPPCRTTYRFPVEPNNVTITNTTYPTFQTRQNSLPYDVLGKSPLLVGRNSL